MTVQTRDNGQLPRPHFACYGCRETIMEPCYLDDEHYWDQQGGTVSREPNPLVMLVPQNQLYPEGRACICVGCTEKSPYRDGDQLFTRLGDANNSHFRAALMVRYRTMMTEPQASPADKAQGQPEEIVAGEEQADPVLVTV